jgi:MFS family permease
VIGPAIAAIVIALTDVGPCFFINALSFVAVVIALLRIDSSELFARRREVAHRGQLMGGLRYVWSTQQLRVPLIMMALIGTLTYEFMVSLPALAARTFHGGASTYGIMTGAMGLGAVAGGLFTARSVRHGTPILIRQALVFGLLVVAAAASPTLLIAVVLLTAVGAASLVFLTRANTTIQLLAAPEMRGRVMALWTVAFLGTTPIGAPTIGFIGQHVGPRWALLVGGIAALVAGAYGAIRLPRTVPQVVAATRS